MSRSVAVCIPSRDQVHATFAQCLALMAAQWSVAHVPNGGRLLMRQSQGTLIANQRQDLVTGALRDGATHILFLDTDMRFPKDTLDRLLAHGKPIVACNYATRRAPVKTVAFANDHNWDCIYTEPDSTGLAPVAAVGMGVMLIDVEVFRRLALPYFAIGYSRQSDSFVGEDIYFCRLARQAGYDVLIDHDLSKEVAHIGTHDYTLADALAERENADGTDDVQRAADRGRLAA